MSLTIKFCEDRANEAAKAASIASLDNVRDISLRAEAAWLAMASRLRMVETARQQHIRDRVAHDILA